MGTAALASGKTVSTTSTLTGGSYGLSATYGGDGSHAGGNSSAASYGGNTNNGVSASPAVSLTVK